MISSSSFSLRLVGPSGDLFARSWDALQSPWVEPGPISVRAEESFSVALECPPGLRHGFRVRLGGEVVGVAPVGATRFQTAEAPWLRDELGESRVVVERPLLRGVEPLFELALVVAPRPEVAADYKVMIEDVAAIHEGLARDLAGRGSGRVGAGKSAVARLHPQAELDRLQATYRRLEAAVASIAEQPSVALARATRRAWYRGGDRLDPSAAATIARDPAAMVDRAGRLVALGKTTLRLPALGDDLPEHRHIADGLRRLAGRAATLARHCDRVADDIAEQEGRWADARPRAGGDEFAGAAALPDRLGLPRAAAFARMADDARTLADEFLALVRSHRFLRTAGLPRTPFGPTPAFLGRPAYRQVYQVLAEARRLSGELAVGDDLRVAYRGMAKLYEYWCFIRAIQHLRHRLGPPTSTDQFALIDEVYRPDLAPGQHFRFEGPGGSEVVATYEPEFHRHRDALGRGDRFAASLTYHPIRPDITVEVRRGPDDDASTMLVLDAKSTEHFRPARLREVTDYARQIYDPRTGRQPVRHVFLLHRGRHQTPHLNLPPHLAALRPDAALLGALPYAPAALDGDRDWLAWSLDHLLGLRKSAEPGSTG
ncbi:MAG TPA: nuclease domain-containing protein [Isosphaeraceae bacterium]|jgi:hypothetical protein|nr:nuclease domain-containing protein [Isosphaeraceae bacterium]